MIRRFCWLVAAYITQAKPSCLLLFMQEAATALIFALLNTGSNIDARIAIMVMTTSSSIKLNPLRRTSRFLIRFISCFLDSMSLKQPRSTVTPNSETGGFHHQPHQGFASLKFWLPADGQLVTLTNPLVEFIPLVQF